MSSYRRATWPSGSCIQSLEELGTGNVEHSRTLRRSDASQDTRPIEGRSKSSGPSSYRDGSDCSHSGERHDPCDVFASAISRFMTVFRCRGRFILRVTKQAQTSFPCALHISSGFQPISGRCGSNNRDPAGRDRPDRTTRSWTFELFKSRARIEVEDRLVRPIKWIRATTSASADLSLMAAIRSSSGFSGAMPFASIALLIHARP